MKGLLPCVCAQVAFYSVSSRILAIIFVTLKITQMMRAYGHTHLHSPPGLVEWAEPCLSFFLTY